MHNGYDSSTWRFGSTCCAAPMASTTRHTDALERRLAEHSDGAVPGYTHDRRPVSLMYSCEFATREEALTMERRIKGWSRAKKEALFREDWRLLRDLSASRDS